MFLKDRNQGQITDELFKAIPSHFDRVEAGELFDEISSVKTGLEMDSLEKAGKAVCFILKWLQARIENVINDEEKIQHSVVAWKIQEIIENEESKDRQKLAKSHPDLILDQLDSGLPIKIQSGGKYSFDLTEESNGDIVSPDTITISAGIDYGVLGAAAVRTMIINPTLEQ